MTDITAPTQYRPWLKDGIARLDREINDMQREIGILQEGLNDLEIERSDLIDQLGRLDQFYESEAHCEPLGCAAFHPKN
jgi:hypothetical protein